jgi:D-glycero-beta-D-manno-heptose-7-phosphate kinase
MKNILIVGDVMLDRYITGRVTRISPEAPIPVVEYLHTDNRLGGAANVALNIHAMHARPYLCSIIGADDEASVYQAQQAQSGLSFQGILNSVTRKTTVKTRILAANQQLLRIDKEDTHDLDETEQAHLLKKINEILDQTPIDALILQDYNKGVLTETTIRTVLKIAQKRQIPTAIDPKKKNFFAYQGATLFKPNLKEIREALPFYVNDSENSLQRAAEYLVQQLHCQYVMITLSEKGLYLYERTVGGKMYAATHPRVIADVCGAGDTVISLAALSLALGHSAEKIATLANLGGGQVCEKVGVVPIDKAQLEQEFGQAIGND